MWFEYFSRARRTVAVASLAFAVARATAEDGAVPQSPASHGLEEIVVTAQRREENLQDVPIAITAFSEDMIERRELSSVADLQHSTPGFVYARVGSNAQPTIRGVGSDLFSVSGEPGVALYLDDIYLGRTFLPQAALVQIERIEVLRGPQGTLYGRNTSGGALKFVSKRPSRELEAMGGIQVGSFDQILGEASVSGPIVENALAARLSLFAEDRDGFMKNLTTGKTLEDQRVLSGRIAADYDPLDWMRLSIMGDFTRQETGGPVFQSVTPVTGTAPSDSAALPVFAPYDAIISDLEERFGIVLDPLREQILADMEGGRSSDDPRKVYLDGPNGNEIESGGVTANLSTDLGFGDATAIAGYRESSLFSRFDGDGSETALVTFDPFIQEGEQVSVELHLASSGDVPFDLGGFRSLTGFFYYQEDAAEYYEGDLFALAPSELAFLEDVVPPDVFPVLQDGTLAQLVSDIEQETRAYAGFGQFDWDPFTWTTLGFGGRYTLDERTMLQTVRSPSPQDSCDRLQLEKSFSAFTGRLGIDLRWDEDRMLYGSFSQGFKAGGFNAQGCNDPFDPEFVDAFEVGLKTTWLDGLVRANVAAFHYSFDDIQVQLIEGARSFTINAAEAGIDGAELELSWLPFADLSLDGSLAWLDARYDEFADDDPTTQFEGEVDLSGNRLPRSPEWSANLGAEWPYAISSIGEVRPRFEWSYRDEVFFDHFNGSDNSQGAYHLWNGFLGFELEGGHWGMQAFVKNLGDETYRVGGIIAALAIGGPLGHYAPPRTWGVEVVGRF